MSLRIHIAFAIIASLVVGSAVVGGFVLTGTPATRRSQLIDERRLQDLRAIVRAIERQSVETNLTGTAPSKGPVSPKRIKQPLPKTLDEAAEKDKYEKLSTRDPETGEQYGYTVVNATTIRLCATFTQARNDQQWVFWNHPAGEHCFTIDVLDPPP